MSGNIDRRQELLKWQMEKKQRASSKHPKLPTQPSLTIKGRLSPAFSTPVKPKANPSTITTSTTTTNLTTTNLTKPTTNPTTTTINPNPTKVINTNKVITKIPQTIHQLKNSSSQTISAQPAEFIYTNGLHFIACRPKNLIVLVKMNLKRNPKFIDLFHPADALAAAQAGNIKLAQAIYRILLLTDYKATERIHYRNGQVKRVHLDYSQDVNLWTAWAWFEERCGNIEQAIQVFELAEQHLQTNVEKLKTEFQLFLLRLHEQVGTPKSLLLSDPMSDSHFDDDQDVASSPLQCPSGPISKLLWRDSQDQTGSPYSDYDDEDLNQLAKLKSSIINLSDSSDDDDYLQREYGIKEIQQRLDDKENQSRSTDVTPKPVSKIAKLQNRKSTPFQQLSSKLGTPLFSAQKQHNDEGGDDDLVTAFMELDVNNAIETSPAGQKFMKLSTQRKSNLPIKSPLSALKNRTNAFNNNVIPKPQTHDVKLLNEEQGSRVTFLTPIRAKKTIQKEFGVEKVITPVRRSVRLHDKQEEKYDLQGLLESHDYAFVPNKNVESSKTPVRFMASGK